MQQGSYDYPVTFSVEYPDRQLDRLTTFFRLFFAIPIFIVLMAVSGGAWESSGDSTSATVGAGGIVVLGPLLMIVFRQKYPRWWFDWNVALTAFSARVAVYLGLMDDRYPSTDEEQSVQLEIAYPDVPNELNRWLPLVKWLLAFPHYIVLLVLTFFGVFALFFAWLAILFTGRYPRGLFDYIEGVMRWHLRVAAYAFLLTTDRYPPFSMS